MTLQPLRGAFTLIETVFAILVFSVGALGLAATSAVIIRALRDNGVRERAARIASSRLEIVRNAACGQAQNGTETNRGITSSWVVSPAGALDSAIVTVTYSLGASAHTDSYTSLFPCKP